MDIATGVPPPTSAPAAPALNTTFTGQNTIYVNNLNERNAFEFRQSNFQFFEFFFSKVSKFPN